MIEKETGVTPRALQDRPEIEYWMPEYLKAFKILSGRRTYGMQANPISLESIQSYINFYGSDDFDEFITLISIMDETHLLATHKKKPSDKEKPQ